MPIPCLKIRGADGTIPLFDADNPFPVAIVDGGVGKDSPIPVTTEDPIDIWIQPTITAGAYTAGDALGGRLDFANAAREAGGGGTITKIVIIDRDSEDSPIDVVFFDQAFTATADNAPFDPSDADLANCIGYVDVAATDYADFSDNSVAAKASGLRMPFDYDLVAGGNTLFAQMVIRAANTYTATDDITIKITIQRR
jgi:hypothetical protein